MTLQRRWPRRWWGVAVALICAGGVATAYWRYAGSGGLLVQRAAGTLPADGREHEVGLVRARRGGRLQRDEVQVRGGRSGAVRLAEEGAGVGVWVDAGVIPGKVRLTVTGRGGAAVLPVTLVEDDADSFGDGTPDWMRLHTEADQLAFRRWFTEMAERAADAPASSLPAEIQDCASLLRYAYREALVAHDDKWYAQFPAQQMPALSSVEQWTYPNTVLGTGLFRTRPGPFASSDAKDGTFAQFADAKTLLTDNAHLIGRDVHRARPGDLIFYRVLEQDSQYHSMILTGEHAQWVVYHTGPIDKHRGEMRRVLVADLLRHPDPRWRPEAVNPNFLGVYRWNILR